MSTAPERFRHDRVLATTERYEVLGGPVVAEENQVTWVAILRDENSSQPIVQWQFHDVTEGRQANFRPRKP